MSNKYNDWWQDNKLFLSLFPAFVFWAVSIIFFMVGLRFQNPIVLWGWDASTAIAISLSVSNTIIQIIGNEKEQEGLGMALWMGWVASYVLGIGTNVVGLLAVLSIDNVVLEWSIAIGLGTMIEVLPERLLVQFLKGFDGKPKKSQIPYKPNSPMSSPGFMNLPPGISRGIPQNRPHSKPQPRPQPKPQTIPQPRVPGQEPTYHPIANKLNSGNK